MPSVSPFEIIGTPINPEERLNARQALARGGLDFDVSLIPVINSVTKQIIVSSAEEAGVREPKFFQVTRVDTSEVLGIVEGRFVPLQNSDVFRIADRLVEQGARIIRVAEIEGGARCFMLVDWVEDDMDIAGDAVGRRAIIQNAHNGKYSAFIRLMPTRRSCGNGLIMPIRGTDHELRLKHTNGNDMRIGEEILRQASSYFTQFESAARKFAQLHISSEVASDILWSLPDFRGRQESAGFQTKVNRIIELFRGDQAGGSVTAVRSTLWGLINALSEFADFDEANKVRVSRGTTEDVQRFKSALSGYSQRLKVALGDALRDRI